MAKERKQKQHHTTYLLLVCVLHFSLIAQFSAILVLSLGLRDLIFHGLLGYTFKAYMSEKPKAQRERERERERER